MVGFVVVFSVYAIGIAALFVIGLWPERKSGDDK